MKSYIITLFLFCLSVNSNGQQPFVLSLEQPYVDQITDVVQVSNRFYFVQNRIQTFIDIYDRDVYSDIVITDLYGNILEIHNLNGFRTEYQRILKVIEDDIYLIGHIKSDSCISKFVISKFNITTNTLENLTYLNLCSNKVQQIKIVQGLAGEIFMEEYHSVGQGYGKHLYKIDSAFNLNLVIDSVSFQQMFSIDFSRKGYLLATSRIYQFFDPDFNYKKQVVKIGDVYYWNETHKPFGKNLLLVETRQDYSDRPDYGIQLRLIDSTLTAKKIAVIPHLPDYSNMLMPFFNGFEISNENEIWATGDFSKHPPNYDIGYYFIAKLDSNLNIICEHFIGFDSGYRLYGIRTFESGGAIVFGTRLRDGHSIEEGEDIYAIRVGENCELPATVSTNGPQEPLLSISAYPNPGLNDLTFSVNGFDPSTLRVELVDESGHLLFSKKDLTNSISVPDFPSGQYFYRILKGEKLMGVGSWVKM